VYIQSLNQATSVRTLKVIKNSHNDDFSKTFFWSTNKSKKINDNRQKWTNNQLIKEMTIQLTAKAAKHLKREGTDLLAERLETPEQLRFEHLRM
jgi:hypothetical protein